MHVCLVSKVTEHLCVWKTDAILSLLKGRNYYIIFEYNFHSDKRRCHRCAHLIGCDDVVVKGDAAAAAAASSDDACSAQHSARPSWRPALAHNDESLQDWSESGWEGIATDRRAKERTINIRVAPVPAKYTALSLLVDCHGISELTAT